MMLELGDPLTEAEIEEFFAAVDKDNDGRMSYEEFVGAPAGGRCLGSRCELTARHRESGDARQDLPA